MDKLDVFMDSTNERLERMENKLDKLWDHKNLLLGGAAVVSAIAGIITSVVIAMIERGDIIK